MIGRMMAILIGEVAEMTRGEVMMLAVAIVLVVLACLFGGGFIYLKIGKARSLKNIQRKMEEDVRGRLETLAGDVGGEVVEGALQTAKGRLALIARGSKQIMIVDVAKFTAPVESPCLLNIVPVKDAGEISPSKVLRLMKPDDAEIAAAYKIFASDEALGRKLAARELVEKLQAIDRAIKARSRLLVTNGEVTIQVVRGLSKPEELKAFYDGCVAAIECLKSRLGA